MRKINWDGPLSREDLAFLSQAGIPGMDEKVRMHQAQFEGAESFPAPPSDSATQVIGGVVVADPVVEETSDVEETPDAPDDDYDDWTKGDLETEIHARNQIEGAENVEVIGTGANGNVKREDMIKALRVWDQTNPGALED